MNQTQPAPTKDQLQKAHTFLVEATAALQVNRPTHNAVMESLNLFHRLIELHYQPGEDKPNG